MTRGENHHGRGERNDRRGVCNEKEEIIGRGGKN
jgi:hypothetical protein